MSYMSKIKEEEKLAIIANGEEWTARPEVGVYVWKGAEVYTRREHFEMCKQKILGALNYFRRILKYDGL